MSQQNFFKLLAFLGFVFIPIRSLLAIVPHKTGLKIQPDAPMDWLAFGVNLIFWGFVFGTIFFIGLSLVGLRKEQKIINDLDNDN